jgi:hemerythrin-like domain-containing protein
VFAELKDVVAEIAASPQQAISLDTRYRELVTRLSALYLPHIQFEDEVLMSLARRILDQGQLENISEEMRTRRSLRKEDKRPTMEVPTSAVARAGRTSAATSSIRSVE